MAISKLNAIITYIISMIGSFYAHQNSFFYLFENMTSIIFHVSFYDFSWRPFQFIPKFAMSNILMEFTGIKIAAMRGDKLP